MKQVRSFLGFGNFYQKFISCFAHLTRPLHNLTKKNKIWDWTPDCQVAFDLLKERFMTTPVLRMPNVNKPFILEMDASKWAIGVSLMQADENGQLHACGYLSHALTLTECNWQIYDQELFTIIYSLKEWRYLLLGALHPIMVRCDHKNLTYYKDLQWWNELSCYNLNLIHTPGMKLTQADALSCQSDHVNTEEDNKLITMLPNKLFVSTLAMDLTECIKTTLDTDELVQSILNQIKLKTSKPDWTINPEGFLLYKAVPYVPLDNDLRQDLIKEYHESPTSGHPGIFKTLVLIKPHYWWPGQTIFVKKYIDGCGICQQMKVNTHPTAAPLMLITSHAHCPFEQITMDFITDLPISEGFDSILVMVDQGLSKGVILCPCNKTMTAAKTADLYLKEGFKCFGLPSIMILDHGPQFTSKVFQAITKGLDIKHKMSTAFHPQTDGQTECLNQELEIYLQMYCAYEPDKWIKHLPIAEFVHNHRTHEGLKQTLFHLMYGSDPVALPQVVYRSDAPAAEECLKSLIKAREEALAAHELACLKMTQMTMR